MQTPQLITVHREKLGRNYRHTIHIDDEIHTVTGDEFAAGVWLKAHVDGWMNAYESVGPTIGNDHDCTSGFQLRKEHARILVEIRQEMERLHYTEEDVAAMFPNLEGQELLDMLIGAEPATEE